MELGGRQYITYVGTRREPSFRIWFFADLHVMNASADMDLLKRDIETVKNDPFSFWSLVGDWGEFIGIKDKRFSPRQFREDVAVRQMGNLARDLRHEVKDLFWPIKHKCIGAGMGNHEEKYERQNEMQDMHAWFCTELGVPNFGYCCLFDVCFIDLRTDRAARKQYKVPLLERQCPRHKYGSKKTTPSHTVRFFQHHGAGGAATPGGKINKLVSFMNSFDADVVVISHVHDQLAKSLVKLGADTKTCTRLVEREQHGLISGTYLRSYAKGQMSHAEQRGYAPAPLGARQVIISPNYGSFKIRVEV